MALGLDCQEGKCYPVCSGTAYCSQYRDGCKDCICLCGCHVTAIEEWIRGEAMNEARQVFAIRLFAESKSILGHSKHYQARIARLAQLLGQVGI